MDGTLDSRSRIEIKKEALTGQTPIFASRFAPPLTI